MPHILTPFGYIDVSENEAAALSVPDRPLRLRALLAAQETDRAIARLKKFQEIK